MAAIKADQIMSMVDSIFENIGYRRWVQGIECLQNQQIYFEICNIVLHSHSIELIKINLYKDSPGDKLQALIQLVSKFIKMNLSHISGQLIVQGNMHHLKNLLQLFECLSQIMVKSEENAPSSVRSTPAADSRQEQWELDNFNHTVFTVLATNHEFRDAYTDSQANTTNKHEGIYSRIRKKSRSSNQKGSAKNSKLNEYHESDPEILEPVIRQKQLGGNDAQKKTYHQFKKQQEKYLPNVTPKQPKKSQIEHSLRKSLGNTKVYIKPKLARKIQPIKQINLLKLNEEIQIAYSKRMYQKVETLEKRRLKDIQDRYIKREENLFKRASQEQLKTQRDHNKLCQIIKQNKACVKYIKQGLQVHFPEFSQELKHTLKNYKKVQRKQRLTNLEAKNQSLISIIGDSQDIGEIQRMVVQIYNA